MIAKQARIAAAKDFGKSTTIKHLRVKDFRVCCKNSSPLGEAFGVSDVADGGGIHCQVHPHVRSQARRGPLRTVTTHWFLGLLGNRQERQMSTIYVHALVGNSVYRCLR